MPNPEDVAAKRQQARDLEVQGFEVLLIERVLVDPPERATPQVSIEQRFRLNDANGQQSSPAPAMSSL